MDAFALRAKDINGAMDSDQPLGFISVGDFFFNMMVTYYLI